MSPRGRVIITGGSGFLGRRLARHLTAAGYDIVIVSRSNPGIESRIGVPDSIPGLVWEAWDARTVGDWARHLEGATAVVNLAGRSVDCIKTPEHCDEILRSRVESTEAIGRALAKVTVPPRVWVQMSTAHIYGDPSEDVLIDEDSGLGQGFAPTVGQAWEAAFDRSCPAGMRQVVFRTSFVLGRDGGALTTLATLARFCLGGKVGHGRQGISWIHEHDMNRLFQRAIEDDTTKGMYIATAPRPVSNAEFMRELRKAIGMPVGLPAFAWMVRLAAPLLLRTDPELALYGRFCVSRRLREEAFEFTYPDLPSALRNLYHPR